MGTISLAVELRILTQVLSYLIWKSRGVNDVRHKIVAVGSRSVESAQNFITKEIKDDSVKAYGSYDELLADQVRSFSNFYDKQEILNTLMLHFRTLT